MGFPSKDLAEFYYQLGALVQAGVPIQQAMGEMAHTAPSNLRRSVAALAEIVNSGKPLREALEIRGWGFPELDRMTISLTERSGALDAGLVSLSQFHEKRAAAWAKIKSGLAYPMCVLGFGIVGNNASTLMAGLQTGNPVALAMFVKQVVFQVVFLALLAGGGIFIGRWLYTVPGLNLLIDRFLKAAPFFGSMQFDYAMSRWVTSLRLLLHAGVGIVQALEMASDLSPSPLIRWAYQRAAPQIARGALVSQALAETRVFPGHVIQLWSTGERSGQLEEMLERLANYFEDRWKHGLDRFAAWLPRLIYGLVMMYMAYRAFISISSFMNQEFEMPGGMDGL